MRSCDSRVIGSRCEPYACTREDLADRLLPAPTAPPLAAPLEAIPPGHRDLVGHLAELEVMRLLGEGAELNTFKSFPDIEVAEYPALSTSTPGSSPPLTFRRWSPRRAPTSSSCSTPPAATAASTTATGSPAAGWPSTAHDGSTALGDDLASVATRRNRARLCAETGVEGVRIREWVRPHTGRAGSPVRVADVTRGSGVAGGDGCAAGRPWSPDASHSVSPSLSGQLGQR